MLHFEGLSSLCSNSGTLKYMLESFYLAWIAFISFGKSLTGFKRALHFLGQIEKDE